MKNIVHGKWKKTCYIRKWVDCVTISTLFLYGLCPWFGSKWLTKVINNLYWLDDIEETQLTDDVNKNLMILKRKNTEKCFTLLDKRILNINPIYRTDKQKHRLQDLINTVRCFKEYPPHVKKGLSECCRFAYFPPQRTIFRTGDPAQALYIIMIGSVTVLREELDPFTNQMKLTVAAILTPGNMFGSGSLMYNTNRSRTVITNEHTQLLVVTKEDFNAVLRTTVQEQWHEITKYMLGHRLFSDWNYKLIKRACMLSRIKTFKRDEQVVDYLNGYSYYSYLIIDGCCRILEHMLLERVGKQYQFYIPSKYSDKVIKKLETPPKLPDNVGIYVLEVCKLRRGSAFGFHENINNRRVLVVSDFVKCLCIPRYWVTSQNRDNRWWQYSLFLNRIIPSSKDVLKAFNLQLRWKQYKKSVANEILSNRKLSSGTLINDVPLSLRVKHCRF